MGLAIELVIQKIPQDNILTNEFAKAMVVFAKLIKGYKVVIGDSGLVLDESGDIRQQISDREGNKAWLPLKISMVNFIRLCNQLTIDDTCEIGAMAGDWDEMLDRR